MVLLVCARNVINYFLEHLKPQEKKKWQGVKTMTDKMFKFYVVFGIFGFWGTMAHDIIPDIVCAIVMVINCVFYFKGERNDR